MRPLLQKELDGKKEVVVEKMETTIGHLDESTKALVQLVY